MMMGAVGLFSFLNGWLFFVFCRQTVNRLFEIKKTNEVLVECYSAETGELVYGLKMERA